MCGLLGVTPRELGIKRSKDPYGVAFLERHLIYRLNEQAKAHEKQRKEMEKSKRRRR
jgi:hypothetical protein